jgi:hypothetical protein
MTTIGATCPSCEFTHGMPGKAVAFKDGLMRCESCGSTWREMGGNAPAPSARAAVRRDLAIPSAPRATILAAVSDATAPSRRRLAAGDGIIWLAAAVAAFSLLAQPFWLMGQWRQLDIASLLPGSRKQIEISMLSASQLENDGRIAVRIEGRIVNRSDRRQPVGDVDITLSQEQGHTVYRWKHRPAVTYLEPGQSIRFSTANGEVPAAASSVEVRSAGSHSVARL